MTSTRIIIADDHNLFVNGLQLLLKDEQWIKIVDVANDGQELMDILTRTKTDIVLLDSNMPRLSGLDAAMHIKRTYPELKIIIVSTYNEEHLLEKAKRIGVNGYLLKNCSREELLETISLVMNNRTSFPYRPPVNSTLFDKEDGFLKQFNLTKREREIIQLLKENLTNQQIADKLFLSVYTVETHRKNIMQKLQLNSPSSLMKFIFDHGL